MSKLKSRNALFIAGAWVTTTRSEAVVNPATEAAIGEAPIGDVVQAEAAIAAARHAFDHGPWPRMKPEQRQAKLTEFIDAIERRADEIVALIVEEAGAVAVLARHHQYGTAVRHARHMIAISSRAAVTPLYVETVPTAQGTNLGAASLSREPVGVVTAITAYNFPFFLNMAKVVPALAVGCTMVVKPSPYTPFEALLLGEAAEEVGLPDGVLNIVTGGVEVGTMLTSDPRVDMVSFTGSDTVGAAIQAQAAPTLKRVVLELGGKSALIVRPDADLRLAAAIGFGGFVTHCGQGCNLLTRHVVHRSVRDEYLALLRAMLEHVKIGDPQDASTTLGPLIREVARQRAEKYVAHALEDGATLIAGGARPADLDKGFFFQPTLFADVANDHRLAQEEVFGPVGAVIDYDSDDEAIAIANDSRFGLSGGICSADVGRAYEMALRIRTGGVALNGGPGWMSSQAPFGGIKRSGHGRENGHEGLNEFTYSKVIGFHAG